MSNHYQETRGSLVMDSKKENMHSYRETRNIHQINYSTYASRCIIPSEIMCLIINVNASNLFQNYDIPIIDQILKIFIMI